MTIIQIDPLETGQHPIQSQSGRRACWLEGYIEVPAHLHDTVWATYGWCNLQIEEGKLVGVTPTERPPEPEPEPQPHYMDFPPVPFQTMCCPSWGNTTSIGGADGSQNRTMRPSFHRQQKKMSSIL